MSKKIVAYLQSFNDYELLPEALASIDGVVDSIIVVDGCYSWMAEYNLSIGINPEKSCDEFYDVVEKSKIPYKVISSIWSNQIDKRMAGYENADADYVMRFDADEILSFDFRELDSFISSNKSVAGMHMPTYITPDVILANESGEFPIQNFLFKRSVISPRDHLEYMWLVLTADKIGGTFEAQNIYEKAIAYNAHLTCWRSLRTSVNRSLYYNTNWMRKHGFDFLDEYKNVSFNDITFKKFFSQLGCENFKNLMLTDKISIGAVEILEGAKCQKINNDNTDIRRLYKKYINSYFSLLPQDLKFIFFNDKEIFFDITSQEALDAFFISGKLYGIVDNHIADVHGYIYVLDEDLNYNKEYLPVTYSDFCFEIKIPNSYLSGGQRFIKRILSVSVRTTAVNSFQYVQFNKK